VASSQQEVDEKIGAYEARKAELRRGGRNVQRLQETKMFQRVLAPFAGTITRATWKSAKLINAGSSDRGWMYRLAKLATLRLYINGRQNAHAPDPDGARWMWCCRNSRQALPGRWSAHAGALDPQSKTLLTEVQVPKRQGELLAGLYATVASR